MSYIVGHPIKRPADFYGRHHQLLRFYELIGGVQAQSVTVLGLRRAGKTSFLQHVAHKEVMARYLPQTDQYTMVYLDVSSCKSPVDFYHRLLVRLKAALGKKIQTGFLWRESPPGSANLYDVETVLCQFPDRRIVLLLDEFDQLRTDSFSSDFLVELRAMTGVLDYDLACVTASHQDLYYLGNKLGLPPTSPFYNIFYPTPIYLPGLESTEIEALICAPLQKSSVVFDQEDVAHIRETAGTLPFFLQATAAQWLRQKQAGQRVDAAHILRQLAADLAPYFDQWWRHFTPNQRTLLRSLVHADLEALPYSVELSEAVRQLQNYGLLLVEGERLRINGAIFTRWIQQYAASADGQLETAVNGLAPTPTHLRQVLTNAFNLEELRTLCFDMGLDFESLPGNDKGAKARNIVTHWQNRQQLGRLIAAIRQERGHIL